MDEQAFLKKANGRARSRLFSKEDYLLFCEQCAEAVACAAQRLPFYWEFNAGGVANSYGYTATTARMGVYTTPKGTVAFVIDRAKTSGRSVKCVFDGGLRSYQKWFQTGGE